LTDSQLLRAHRASWAVKETARAIVKAELGLDKEHPGVPYRVNDDGGFTIQSDPSVLVWTAPDGSPGPLPVIRQNDRNRARTRALAAIESIEKPVGTSAVMVE